ncbi:MAG TPA: hypothetical protein QF753_12105 [Victivallales bacterium]|nr:hypothetical protein [Victivallales bacterium]
MSNVLKKTLIAGVFICSVFFAVFAGNVASNTSIPVLKRSDETAKEHNDRAMAYHKIRYLDMATEEYEKTLKLDQPKQPTKEQLELVYKFTPLLFIHPDEFFKLKDIAAIIHPNARVIGYHLFWEDDIDFPDDNDPCDHEVVWVEYTKDKKNIENCYFYFHSRIIKAGKEALENANKHGGRIHVNVQWGKHGSFPIDWKKNKIIADKRDAEKDYYKLNTPIPLNEYMYGTYKKLHTVGRRNITSPLGKNWPKKFTGTYNDFLNTTNLLDPLSMLKKKKMIMVSYWSNAVINRYFLPYNFRAKTEWPRQFQK